MHLSQKDSKQLHAYQHYYLICILAELELLKKCAATCYASRLASHQPADIYMSFQMNVTLGCAFAATSGRLVQARTDLLLTIAEQIQKEGVLYTLPPYHDDSPYSTALPEDADPNAEPQGIRNDK